MSASYPGAIKSFEQRTDNVDDVMATDINQAYVEIEALQSALGANLSNVVRQSLADARGDIIAASGNDAWARVPVGANGLVLTADNLAPAGVSWQAIPPAGRVLLTADRTYFVRTDGSDSNNGLTNTSGGAFLTIQRAVDVAAALDRSAHNVTIQVGNGTYNIGTTPITLREGVGQRRILITGDVATPANVIIQTGAFTTANIGAFFANGIVTQYEIKGFRFATTSYNAAICALYGSVVYYGNCDFAGGWVYHLEALFGGIVECVGNYTISGGASNAHITARASAGARVQGYTLTLTGTPAFAQFVECRYSATMFLTTNTYSGSASAGTRRFNIDFNAVVQTIGATLPGGTAGVTATGGHYA